jgi:hypothetical protein
MSDLEIGPMGDRAIMFLKDFHWTVSEIRDYM